MAISREPPSSARLGKPASTESHATSPLKVPSQFMLASPGAARDGDSSPSLISDKPSSEVAAEDTPGTTGADVAFPPLVAQPWISMRMLRNSGMPAPSLALATWTLISTCGTLFSDACGQLRAKRTSPSRSTSPAKRTLTVPTSSARTTHTSASPIRLVFCVAVDTSTSPRSAAATTSLVYVALARSVNEMPSSGSGKVLMATKPQRVTPATAGTSSSEPPSSPSNHFPPAAFSNNVPSTDAAYRWNNPTEIPPGRLALPHRRFMPAVSPAPPQ
mmetsp:Transcript_2882/g.6490  ORF Transcript_2882/g.6490 Transcript_2882/m.6490 type:complete len:274 (+) Transcript_2882:262-1083(+)